MFVQISRPINWYFIGGLLNIHVHKNKTYALDTATKHEDMHFKNLVCHVASNVYKPKNGGACGKVKQFVLLCSIEW
jgi:hypothetical protein